MEININTKEITEPILKLKDLCAEDGRKAISAALNRTLNRAKTLVKRDVPKRYIVNRDTVDEALKPLKSSPSTLNARLVVKGERIPIDKMEITPKVPQSFKGLPIAARQPVKVRVVKGSPFKIISTKSPAPFIQRKSGVIGIFRRQPHHKDHWAKVVAVSVPQMVGEVASQPAFEQDIQSTMEKRLEHEINYRLEKKGFK